jgi:Fe-S-cluster formation regulator IscX/YfhJ
MTALLMALSYAQSASADLAVAPYEDRPAVYNALLTERLDTLLPKLMRETQIDMWVVIAREYNDDPIFLSLGTKATLYRKTNDHAGVFRSRRCGRRKANGESLSLGFNV